MSPRRFVVLLGSVIAMAACSGEGEDGGGTLILPGDEGAGGASGSSAAGAAGASGASGQSGSAGTSAGKGGASGTAGAGGSSGGASGGSGGSSAGGASGKGGASGGAGGASAGSGGSGASGKGGASGGTGGAGGAGGAGTAGKAGAAGSSGSPGGCPSITYPSGVVLQTKPDAALAAEYTKLGVSSCTLPKCFLDTLDLQSPDGTKHDVHVMLAPHFSLYEMVRSEVDPSSTGGVDKANAYSTSVLVDPVAMDYLEKLRTAYGGPVNITSGFRSPPHQHAVCQSICGQNQCTDASGTVTCAKNSRHMWGAAADMSLMYEAAANAAGFPFVFHENGGTAPHLHVDTQSCN